MTASVGDIMAHSSAVLHRAGRNTTPDRQRRAIGLVYFGVSAKADEVALAAYQKRLLESLTAAKKV
jgi:phytanoyl-CoA hydroxylase